MRTLSGAPGEITPFEVPLDYRFEAEFDPPSPRPLPEFVVRGRFIKNQRRARRGLFLLGSFCVLAHFLPTTHELALTVPPLGWLILPGIACILACIVSWLVVGLGRSDLRYLTVGIPVVAEIINVYESSAGSATPLLQDVNITARLRHPTTDETILRHFSVLMSRTSEHDKTQSLPSQGDLVTAIYLPDAFETTLALYGFLGLNPDVEFVEKSNLMAWVTGGLVLGLGLLGVAMPLGFDKIDRMRPIAIPDNAWLPLIVGGVVVALLTGAAWRVLFRERTARSKGCLGRVFNGLTMAGVPLMLGTMMWFTMIAVNATFDRSTATARAVVLMGQEIDVSLKGFLQQHQVTYSFADDATVSKHIRVAAPGEYKALSGLGRSTAHIKAGFLGWPWLKRIGPIEGP